MPKFFVDKNAISGDTAKITGQDANHIIRVLRMSEGDGLVICDGEGTDYSAEIDGFSDGAVSLTLKEKMTCESETDIKVTIFQCLPKGSKMDLIIEKCTELGVSEIVPVASKYCVVKIEDAAKEAKKTAKWQKTADEAAKQCRRGVIPKVSGVVTLKDAAKTVKDFDLLIAAYELEDKTSLKDVLTQNKGAKKVGIFIGPEGGFDEEEIDILTQNGAKAVTLGKRILRTETAGLSVLSCVMYELGGF